jgi:pyruvate dehydrogenase E2 component (dihydrolipoamide acetyltransferase)
LRELVMPKSTMTMTEGEVVRWLVEDGQDVREGELVVEIMTDKVNLDVEAPTDGRLRILAKPGETVDVGTAIGVILAEGEEAPADLGATGEDTTAAAATEARTDKDELEAPRPVAEAPDPEAVTSLPGDGDGERRPRASPAARAMAKRLGVDLTAIQGTGPRGRILPQDITSEAGEGATAETTATGSPERAAPAAEREGEPAIRRRFRPTGVRGVMARRMAEAASIPQFTLFADVSFSAAERARRATNQRGNARVSLTDVVLRAVALALGEHPALNAHWAEGEIVEFEDPNLGVAVDTDQGLVVPVIHRAHTLDLPTLSFRRGELVEAARSGRLVPEQLSGATFTVSNLGMFGIDVFQPVVNPPQVALLSVGRTREDADGTTTLGLAADHRAVDGVQAARFLERVRELIEWPGVFTPGSA